jgi:hypothetical protein
MRVPHLKYIDLSSNHIVEWTKFSDLRSDRLELINLQNNKMGCLDNFIKLIGGGSGKKIVNFCSNEVT